MVTIPKGLRVCVRSRVGWRFRVGLVALFSSVGGCSGDDDPKLRQLPPPTASSSQSGATGAEPAQAGAPVQGEPARAAAQGGAQADADALPAPKPGMVWVSGTVNNLGGRRKPGTQVGVAEVCVYQQGDLPCTRTDDVSHFDIQVPAHAEVALLFRGAGLTPTLRTFLTGETQVELGNTRVANDKGVTGVAKALGENYRKNLGTVFFGGVEGVQAKLAGGGGTTFFLDRIGNLMAGQKAVPMHGMGGILNVNPGEARLRFSLPEGSCRFRRDNLLSGWPSLEAPDVARVPIAPGHHTHMVTMLCAKDQAGGGETKR